MDKGLCRLAVVLVLSSAMTAGCALVSRKDARDPYDLFRAAIDNTFALTRVRFVEETAFPSSKKLLSARDARALGTGMWTRIVEFEAPDRVHYSSSSEDSGLEAYRVGSSIAYRLTGLETPDDAGGTWLRVADVKGIEDDGVRSELEWLSGIRGVDGVIDGGLRDAKNVKKVGEEQINGIRYTVLSLEIPQWSERFEGSLQEGAIPAKPVKHEVKVWVTSRGEPLLHKIEDMYVYQEQKSGLYEYVMSTRVFEPAPDLEIKLP